MNKSALLINLLINPFCCQSWSVTDWDILIQEGYATGLLARIYIKLQQCGANKYIPNAMLWHFTSANKIYNAHYHDVEIEIKEIRKALEFIGIEPIFLKGAAYIACDDSANKGRLFNDVDIYISKNQVKQAEEILKWQHWESDDIDDYDEQYFREWMHEIPPMVNKKSGMTLDVHHNLLPIVSKITMDAEKLEQRIVKNKITGYTLSPEDRILHSAVHLLLNSEFDKGFRDLSDIDLMIKQQHDINKNFMTILIDRAHELGINRILFYCLRYRCKIFKATMPNTITEKINPFKPSSFVLAIMDFCFLRALKPHHENYMDIGTRPALQILFLRSHWLKMPIHILIPHLFHKAFITPYLAWKKSRELINNNESA